MRLFAAINPPESVLHHLEAALSALGDLPPAPQRWRQRERGPARRAALRSPWTPRETWHITLGFFGEVPDGAVPDLRAALAGTAQELEPFQVHLAGAGTFRSTTTWIGVGGQTRAVTETMRAIGEVREAHTSTRDAHVRNRAHLTVSRAGATFDSAHAAHALAVYRGPQWQVDSIDLIQSELGGAEQGRPLHTIVETFPLGET